MLENRLSSRGRDEDDEHPVTTFRWGKKGRAKLKKSEAIYIAAWVHSQHGCAKWVRHWGQRPIAHMCADCRASVRPQSFRATAGWERLVCQ